MKRILVTGASGLLGLNMVLQTGGPYEVFGVLRRKPLVPAASLPFQALTGDLLLPEQIDQLIDQAQPDAVIHCVALTDVDYCESHAAEAAEVNANVAGRVAEATARRGIALMHISTDAVFDGLKGSYDENDTPCPLNVYGKTKLDGERLVAEANPDAIIARVNFYGWSWQGKRSLAEWFYNQLSAGKAVRGFTDLVFCPLFVSHLIDALLRMIDLKLSGLYHVVSSECLSKYDFGTLLARRFGFDEGLISPACYHTGNLVARRSRYLTLCTDKLERVLGGPLPNQEAGMQRFYDLHCQGYPQTLRAMFS